MQILNMKWFNVIHYHHPQHHIHFQKISLFCFSLAFKKNSFILEFKHVKIRRNSNGSQTDPRMSNFWNVRMIE